VGEPGLHVSVAHQEVPMKICTSCTLWFMF